MASIYDLDYEFYLVPKDLQDRAQVVTISNVSVKKYYNQRERREERKIVLRFMNRRKCMILNKTQVSDAARIIGSEDYTRWVGAELVLVEDEARGRATIRITTRALSGDADLAFQSRQPVTVTPNVPVGWWKTLEEHGKAVLFAARVWNVSEKEAWGRLSQAVHDEAISAYNPPEQFMEWVQIGNVK